MARASTTAAKREVAAVAKDDGLLVLGIGIGLGFLALKLLTDSSASSASNASDASSASRGSTDTGPSSSDASTPQARPGPVDAGGPFSVYAFPPGTAPKDIADWFA